MAQQAMQPQYLFKGASLARVSQWIPDLGVRPSFHAAISGQGAVSAVVRIYGRNIPNGQKFRIGDITLSGTGSDNGPGWTLIRYGEYSAEILSITGTGALLDMVMSS